ncbi:MAG: hydroxyacylglutathione hydrolase [Oligoflexus sp.]
MMLDVQQIPVLNDNYIYLIKDQSTARVAVVDPAEAGPVIRLLEQLDWQLDYILNTHHHYDHVGGNMELKRYYSCHIIGPKADEQRIPGIDQALSDGEWGSVGQAKFQFFDTPGHTRGHGVYWFPDDERLFCGDTLFSLGCGRLFEGTPAQMWASLTKIRQLPDSTRVYCAHEYTAANARFALTMEPENKNLQAYAEEIFKKRTNDEPTIPCTLGQEKLCNPFLRADQEDLQRQLGLAGAKPVEVFAHVRQSKDRF